jgi:hypothetical protein
MKTFGETRNEISQYKIFNNKVALDKISRKSRKDGQLPLEYSSDEDFDYEPGFADNIVNHEDNLFE